ncbi:MFS transporter [Ralstonia pseudosolanacearum]|uniref:MFS transporter n=1 Tax=Ralstonia pseudosolanacearum TaxID=1310165 RepID=UPI002675ABE5|nr:MFS transporter [Ralstonia pseudosolanacearum]MDO3526170.1 MFS transporter [Ralstonia pseudosolanacearum]
MFACEAAFHQHRKKHGKREAIEYIADVNRHTAFHLPSGKDGRKPAGSSLAWSPTLFDRNEHFIETSNMGEESRSLEFLLSILLLLFPALPVVAFAVGLLNSADWSFIFFTISMLMATIFFIALFWPSTIAPTFFTYLRARYRFNRTTRQVYVLRPKRYGGNVILDWDRVKAHVNWCAPREMTPDQIGDKSARQRRQERGGGPSGIRGLVLYWPPLDPDDPERKGEDVLWVGPKLAGEPLWQYIRTFMEEGMDKVPEPNEYEWLRKGFHTPGQHLEETELSASRALDDLGGRGHNSAQTQFAFLMTFLWAPLHCLAERLCKWPTFPEEWNSDCGQKRREDGIGPEEPVRWKPSLENIVVEQRPRAHV